MTSPEKQSDKTTHKRI